MLLLNPHCKQFLPLLPPTLHSRGRWSFPSSDSLAPGIGVHLHLALPHEDPSQYPKVELVFALGLSGCYPMGTLVVWASVDLPRVQSHGCWWWRGRVQGDAEGQQHLGYLPCVLSHKSLGEKLRILQTNCQILLEI